MTVSIFDGYRQALNQNINWGEGNTPAITKMMQEGMATGDMKYVYMAELIRKAR